MEEVIVPPVFFGSSNKRKSVAGKRKASDVAANGDKQKKSKNNKKPSNKFDASKSSFVQIGSSVNERGGWKSIDLDLPSLSHEDYIPFQLDEIDPSTINLESLMAAPKKKRNKQETEEFDMMAKLLKLDESSKAHKIKMAGKPEGDDKKKKEKTKIQKNSRRNKEGAVLAVAAKYDVPDDEQDPKESEVQEKPKAESTTLTQKQKDRKKSKNQHKKAKRLQKKSTSTDTSVDADVSDAKSAPSAPAAIEKPAEKPAKKRKTSQAKDSNKPIASLWVDKNEQERLSTQVPVAASSSAAPSTVEQAPEDEDFTIPTEATDNSEEGNGADKGDEHNAGVTKPQTWAEFKLHPLLQKGIDELAFEKPTPIQQEVIPFALGGCDVIGAAQTGSGKTLAFGIPVLNKLARFRDEFPPEQHPDKWGLLRCLVIVPTRELAIQVTEHLKAVSKFMSVDIVNVVGGLHTEKQVRQLKRSPEIVVGTPGRLWEMMQIGDSHLSTLRGILCLVIDEADRMIEGGHFPELTSILGRLHDQSRAMSQADVLREQINAKLTSVDRITESNLDLSELLNAPQEDESDQDEEPLNKRDQRRKDKKSAQKEKRKNRERDFQTFVFSATLTDAIVEPFRKKSKKSKAQSTPTTPLENLVKQINFSQNVQLFDLSTEQVTASALRETLIQCTNEEKDYYLYYLLARHPGRTLLFDNSIDGVRRLAGVLRALRLPVFPLHANMEQGQRLSNLENFRKDPNSILVATDVAARGLDIPAIDHVIHFQLPRNAQTYVHRSGRTARANASGISVILLGPDDKKTFNTLSMSLGKYKAFEEFPISLQYMPGVRARVDIGKEIDVMTHRAAKRRGDQRFIKNSTEALGLADVMSSEEELSEEEQERRSQSAARSNKRLASLKQELTKLLQRPLDASNINGAYITQMNMLSTLPKQKQKIRRR